ncbi:MAG: hypothetical protein LBG86_01180, partial [Puniceicoccales bacterium]|nr:hypothetical protein [Puniceicoccales bacterium]
EEILQVLLTYVPTKLDFMLLTRKLLDYFKNFRNVLDGNLQMHMTIEGMSEKCSLFLVFIRELAKLIYLQRTFLRKRKWENSKKELYGLWAARLSGEKLEFLEVAYVDSSHCFNANAIERVGCGDMHSVPIMLHAIAKSALSRECCALVLCHNHPSGNPFPSELDEKFTKKTSQFLDRVSIELLDHVIIAKGRVYSMKYGKELHIREGRVSD